jgi:hypothetical protein
MKCSFIHFIHPGDQNTLIQDMSDNIIGRRQKVDNPDHYVIKPNLFFYIY